MKELRLERLKMENFKGQKSLEVFFNRGDTHIYGANNTGKTTIADAWFWLLFGKNTELQSEFPVKPLDENNNEIHGLHTIVEATIRYDDKKYELIKIQSEKRPKKRGQSEAAYGGNTTDYIIDGVPFRASDWKAFIQDIADEELFKTLSLSSYFSLNVDWKKRRAILFEMADNSATPLSIAQSGKQYAPVVELLEQHDIDNARKKVMRQIKELKKDIEEIPIRIDQESKNLADIDEEAIRAAEEKEKGLSERVNDLDEQIALSSKNTGALQAFTIQISSLNERKQGKIEKARSKALQSFYEGKDALMRAKSCCQQNEREIKELGAKRDALTFANEARAKEKAALVESYYALQKEEYAAPDPDNGICPTCKQALPPKSHEELEDLHQKWVDHQMALLEENKAKGIKLNEEIKKTNNEITELTAQIEKLSTELLGVQEEIESLSEFAGEPPEITVSVDTSEEDAEIERLKAESEKAQHIDLVAIRMERADINTELHRVQSLIARKEQVDKSRQQIEALEAKERDLNNMLASIEQQRDLLEEIVREQCSRVEESINSRFTTVKWKLFKTFIGHDGIEDCCECLIGGVPYANANNAAQVNSGIEIASAFSEHHGIRVPMFVDNAESVNELQKTESQMIALVVSNDRPLRIENEKESEVA